jgi:hypothetical protein
VVNEIKFLFPLISMVLLLMEMCTVQSSFHVKKKCEAMVSYTSSSFYSVEIFFLHLFFWPVQCIQNSQMELLQGEVKPITMGSLRLNAAH